MKEERFFETSVSFAQPHNFIFQKTGILDYITAKTSHFTQYRNVPPYTLYAERIVSEKVLFHGRFFQ
jgi:hypothetical protein